MEQESKKNQPHEVRVTDRSTLIASGVLFVESFDEAALMISTVLGELIIEGKSLKIEEFSKEEGTIRICGKISGYYYNEPREKKKLFERFFT